LQFRILLGPAPSLHGLRCGRGRFVRSLPRYFRARSDFLHRTHRRLRPPAFPTTSGHDWRGRRWRSPVPVQKASAHARVYDDAGSAWCLAISTPAVLPSVGRKTSAPRTCLTPLNTSPTPSPVNASRLPSRTTRASLGAGTVRYTFTVTDFHRLPLAGLPAHPPTASEADVTFCWRLACRIEKRASRHSPSNGLAGAKPSRPLLSSQTEPSTIRLQYRRLVTIDVVGYSRLMGHDKSCTVVRLKVRGRTRAMTETTT